MLRLRGMGSRHVTFSIFKFILFRDAALTGQVESYFEK